MKVTVITFQPLTPKKSLTEGDKTSQFCNNALEYTHPTKIEMTKIPRKIFVRNQIVKRSSNIQYPVKIINNQVDEIENRVSGMGIGDGIDEGGLADSMPRIGLSKTGYFYTIIYNIYGRGIVFGTSSWWE